MSHTYIIAEAGTMHGGSPAKAFDLIRIAQQAGADAIKFQMFQPHEIVDEGDDLWPFFDSVKLPDSAWQELRDATREAGIEFMCSVFGDWSAELYESLGGHHWKIASRSQYDWNLIETAETMKKGNLLISTGMYCKGLTQYVEELRNHGIWVDDVVLMHCVSEYPTRPENAALANIKSIHELKWTPGRPSTIGCGYSDHTEDWEACLAAVALGATWIEKHIKLPLQQDHPDASCALDTVNFGRMVHSIRKLERMLP